MLKKKFHLHLDALIFIVLLFVLSMGGNILLFTMYDQASTEALKFQIKGQVDELNLASQKAYITELEAKMADCGCE